MRVMTIEMEQSFVTQHKKLFMTLVQGATKETMTMHVYFLHGLVSLKFTLPVPVITKLYFYLCSMR